MLRIASQYVFCSPQQILKRMVVEQNSQKVVKQLFGLDDSFVESSQTLFFDGILSIGIVSVKQSLLPLNTPQLLNDYQYVDFSITDPTKSIIPSNKPLILDFGCDNIDVINREFPLLSTVLAHFSVYEIIAACTYYPSLLLQQPALLEANYYGNIQLWEGIDLLNKKITERTKIRVF